MELPSDFHFSQANLQAYVDCERRFQLRYLQHVAWPAVESEPALENERLIKQGEAFHRLVHQSLIGLPDDLILRTVKDDELRLWWLNFTQDVRPRISGVYFPETSLWTPLNGFRLVAQYDLITVQPDGRVAIYDWKTSRNRASRQWLAQRLQTRVYLFLIVSAFGQLNQGHALQPEQTEMIYWFANHSQSPEHFRYTTSLYHTDAAYLSGLVETILLKQESDFPLCANEKNCGFCTYRSLCNRGIHAEIRDDVGVDEKTGTSYSQAIDFDQIAEMEL